MLHLIRNARIIHGSELLENCALLYDKKILGIVPDTQACGGNCDVIDAGGAYLSPGFIDIHKHGAYGYDFMDAVNTEAVKLLARLPETGVTSLYPTTMSMPKPDVRRAVEAIRELMTAEYAGTRVLGCHMEGPYISPDWGGAQPREYIVPADYALVEGVVDTIKYVTLAPEVPGNMDFIRCCVAAGIRVSIGHTSAHYEDAMAAFAAGARSVTHTFNAMRQLQHRDPGVVAAASESPGVFCELICDDLHVHPAAQRVLLKLKGIDQMILVTDSMRFAGLGYGVSELAGQRVTINEKGARLDNGSLAGSVLAMNDAVINYRRSNHLSIPDAVKPVTANPAKLMGVYGQKGVIECGADADFVLFDEDVRIIRTIIGGDVVYISQAAARRGQDRAGSWAE